VLLGAGTQLLNRGDTSAAEQLFQEAIARNPGDPAAHYDLGVVYQREGRRPDALLQYDKAIHIDRNYIPALFNEAIMYTSTHPELSAFYYRRIIRLNPKAASAFLNLGIIAADRGGKRLARKAIGRALALDPSLRRDLPPKLRKEYGGGHG
jgi:Flp pilus assembly protein TadD